jgi:molecular chaperone GrpE
VEAAAPPDRSTPDADVAELSELERLRAEAGEMRDLAQRKQAEFENYRKRMERERLDVGRYAGAEVVKEILPVLDNLERALRSGGSEEQLRDGVAIIHRQLQETLTRLGLTEVESQGKPFDPHIHEAVSQQESVDHAEGTVLDVFQKGYLFKDRLLRPAMVSVARRPPGENQDHDADRSASDDEGGAVGRSD